MYFADYMMPHHLEVEVQIEEVVRYPNDSRDPKTSREIVHTKAFYEKGDTARGEYRSSTGSQ